MATKIFHGNTVALVLFPTMSALAAQLIWGRFIEAGVALAVDKQCKPDFVAAPGSGQKAYYTPFTGIAPFDNGICPLVAFFDIMINSPNTLPYLTYVIGTSLPLALLPNAESYRSSHSWTLKYPVIWCLLTQGVAVGFVQPLYWLTFILTGGMKDARSSISTFTKSQAEALIFALIVGSVIPSVAMLIMNDFHVIAIWQFYPALVSIAQILHLQYRPQAEEVKSGYGLMQALYIGCFLATSSAHISSVWPILDNMTELEGLLLPSLTPLPSAADISLHLLEFLKWDMTFAYASTALATCWLARNAKQLLAILLWYAVAIPLVGSGAAVMGVTIWKEGMLA
ncbi:hypothetical protein BDN70DRAFT_282798 [Pholiota conissans]|uniref:Uncharacterized protein n=1 Tax=Pholiota conissans TaxID=109636 RepID=A0A9P5YSI8_9AGAR|nr:hypothetical protein BDN70DRAFT_282798 [Pholiota conissans]